jgi:hypothetical protein
MAQSFEKVLSKHFDNSEITQLKTRVDYEEIKEKIKQIQANGMLDDLE